MKKGDLFEYRGDVYEALYAPLHTMPCDKCALCALNDGGVKLCLRNDCKCGTCMDNHVIFKKLSESNTNDEQVLKRHIKLLKKYNDELNNHIDELQKENNRLEKRINELNCKINGIYLKCNKALKEVFKNDKFDI